MIKNLTNEELLSDLLIWHAIVGAGGCSECDEDRFYALRQEVEDRMKQEVQV